MIQHTECMSLILKKFPNFKTAWQNHLDWWEGEIPGFSNDMSAFSHYVLEQLKNNNQDTQEETKNIFVFIEKLLTQGDELTKDAAATCFLENLINAVSWKRISALSFVHLLGQESKKYCLAWDEFCGVKTEGLWSNEGE